MTKLMRHATSIVSVVFIMFAMVNGDACADAVSGQGTWEGTLQARYLTSSQINGPDAYFDTALNITWLANTRLSVVSNFGVPLIGSDGRMSWNTAQQWLASLNAGNYLGYSDWRLPQTYDFSASYSPSPNSSEMAHLYYTTLGNPDYFHGPIQNTGPFANLPGFYWSGVYPYDSTYAEYFNMNWGNQQFEQQGASMNVMVVRSGDVTPVPIPTSSGLFLSGATIFIVIIRRRFS